MRSSNESSAPRQIEPGVGGQSPEPPRGRVGIAGDGEEAPEHGLLFGADIGLRARRGLFEEAVGDFAGAAPADRGDAGDGEQVLDQRLGAGVVGALERGQHARLASAPRRIAVHDRLQRAPAREAAPHPAQPDFRQAERGEHAVEQPRVAEAHRQRPRPGDFGRLQRQRENFGVGGLDVPAAVAFEARLGHLAALAGAGAKDRAEIGVLRLPARLGRGEIGEADRNGVIRAQAQFGARGVAGQVEPPANFLAGHVEKDRGGLQHGRLEARETGGEKMFERAPARFERGRMGPGRFGRLGWRGRVHDIFLVFEASFNKPARRAQPFSRPR